jgi:hypothetical protein
MLNEELVDQGPGLDFMLAEAIDAGDFPPSYKEHPVVVQNPGELVLPIALYLDAVPYTLTDSVLGIWIINMLTGARHLFCVIRKRFVCRCGCRGWCTFFGLLQYIHWCIAALAAGVFPQRRHDGSEFGVADEAHAALAGLAMVKKCALLHLQGDWAEFCERFGFPTWQSFLRPCLFCNAFPDNLMENLAAVSPVGLPWCVNSVEDYNAACTKCEIWVNLTAACQTLLQPLLHYDKRKEGSHGRALLENVPELGLLKGDRLEPCAQLPDVGKFGSLIALPMMVLFWRPSFDTLCLHRCPLFDEGIGVTAASIALDVLHCLHMGVFKAWAKVVLWKLVLAGVWGDVAGHLEERLPIAVMALRHELFAWYKTRHAAAPEEGLTRLADLTAKMVGTPAAQLLKTKGAETWGVCLFLVCVLERNTAVIEDGASLFGAGQAIVQHMEVINSSGCQLSTQALQQLFDTLKRHLLLMRGQESDLPKHHQWIHMVDRAAFTGNPRFHANWLNESLNKTMKASARNCSQLTFEPSLLFKMRGALRQLLGKRTRPGV